MHFHCNFFPLEHEHDNSGPGMPELQTSRNNMNVLNNRATMKSAMSFSTPAFGPHGAIHGPQPVIPRHRKQVINHLLCLHLHRGARVFLLSFIKILQRRKDRCQYLGTLVVRRLLASAMLQGPTSPEIIAFINANSTIEGGHISPAPTPNSRSTHFADLHTSDERQYTSSMAATTFTQVHRAHPGTQDHHLAAGHRR